MKGGEWQEEVGIEIRNWKTGNRKSVTRRVHVHKRQGGKELGEKSSGPRPFSEYQGGTAPSESKRFFTSWTPFGMTGFLTGRETKRRD